VTLVFRQSTRKADARNTLQSELNEFVKSAKFEPMQAKRYVDALLHRFDEISWPDPDRAWITDIHDLHEYLIVVPCDKAPQSLAGICKRSYLQEIHKVLQNYELAEDTETVKKAIDSFTTLADNLSLPGSTTRDLPYIYLLPKLHKTTTELAEGCAKTEHRHTTRTIWFELFVFFHKSFLTEHR